MKRSTGERFQYAEGQTKMGEKGVGKLSQETHPPREGEPMGAVDRIKSKISQNEFKQSMVNHAYLSAQTHAARVTRCLIGHEELMKFM